MFVNFVRCVIIHFHSFKFYVKSYKLQKELEWIVTMNAETVVKMGALLPPRIKNGKMKLLKN